jgi:archaellum component FlaF (FlaF/FlaG flagellin family)
MTNEEVQNTDNSLENYYAFHRAVVIINYNKNDRTGKSTIESRQIGRVFTDYKDNLVVIDGDNKKEHEYLIPKSKIDHYDDKKIFLNISYDSLNEFEI